MRSTRIVTCFLTNNGKFLILKRSNKVKTMKGLWAGISGIIEKNETPFERAKTEIYEEVGINQNKIRLIKEAIEMLVSSPQYQNHQWMVFPFLFEATKPQINLNWENSEYKWIFVEELKNYKTVPSLDKVLFSLL